MRQFSSLHAYRGIAALLVLLHHASQITEKYCGRPYDRGIFSFGFAGVDFFFVLSGFIITHVHMHDIGQRAAVRPYLWKRFVRIYPLYWIVTLALLPVYFARPDFGRGEETKAWTILTSLLLIPQPDGPILTVAWTLCHEIKFYLLFALAILLGPASARRLFFAITGISTVLLTIEIAEHRLNSASFLLQFLFSRYNLEFALGCLSAWVIIHSPPPAPRLICLIGLLGFAAAALFQNDSGVFTETNSIATFGLASTSLVLGAAAHELREAAARNRDLNSDRSRRHRLAEMRPFRFLGDASYSLYLTHTVSLSALAKLFSQLDLQHTLGLLGSGTLMTIAAMGTGCLFHVTVERQLLRWSKHRTVG